MFVQFTFNTGQPHPRSKTKPGGNFWKCTTTIRGILTPSQVFNNIEYYKMSIETHVSILNPACLTWNSRISDTYLFSKVALLRTFLQMAVWGPSLPASSRNRWLSKYSMSIIHISTIFVSTQTLKPDIIQFERLRDGDRFFFTHRADEENSVRWKNCLFATIQWWECDASNTLFMLSHG